MPWPVPQQPAYSGSHQSAPIQPRPSNPSSVLSLVLGIVAVLLSLGSIILFFAVMAVLFGLGALVWGMVGIDRANKTGAGRGLSVAGLIIGSVAVVLCIVGLGFRGA